MPEHVNTFAGLALERNAERREDAGFGAAKRADQRARFLLLDAGRPGSRRVLVAAAPPRLRWLSREEATALGLALEATYLGDDGQGPLFSLGADAAQATRAAQLPGVAWMDLRAAGAALSGFEAGVFAYARALAFWQARTRFCGACGAPLELVAFGHRGQCSNPACGLEHFPRVDPAMIVIVGWRERCLLGRQPSWDPGRYSALAGFVEPGESIEDAVRREVYEEAGVRVGACRYHSSQPWPFPSSLMLGFRAEALDPALRIGPELADARWFGVDELVEGVRSGSLGVPPPLSVAHRLIADWLREHSGLELAELAGPIHRDM